MRPTRIPIYGLTPFLVAEVARMAPTEYGKGAQLPGALPALEGMHPVSPFGRANLHPRRNPLDRQR
jgi:hypothetical protein